MSTSPTAEQIISNAVALGRDYVRMIEAADVILDWRPVWAERLLLRLVRALYRHRSRGPVAVLPADLSADILAASEKMTGPVKDYSHN